MGNNTWMNVLDPHPVARGAAFNTFTAAKDVSPVPLAVSYAYELKKGTKVCLEAAGEYSTTGTPTMRLGFAYGITSAGGLLSTGVELAGSDLVATGTATAWGWHLNYFGVVTSVDTPGTATIYGSGFIDLDRKSTRLN